MECKKLYVGIEDMKQTLFNLIDDTIAKLLYYDRKEDEDMPRGKIEEMIASGEVTVDEIVNRFKDQLVKGLKSQN